MADVTSSIGRASRRPTAPALLWCPPFERDYRRSGEVMKARIETAARDLHRRSTADPPGWRSAYNRVQSFRQPNGKKPLEVDLGGGPRMVVADFDGVVVLWRAGNHETTTRAALGALPDISACSPVPEAFRDRPATRFFPADEDLGIRFSDRLPEQLRDWFYTLDDQQAGIAEDVAESVVDAVLGDRRVIHVIAGGPGTGKTTLLAWLLKHLGCPEAGGFDLNIRLSFPSGVVEQLASVTGWSLEDLQLDLVGATDVTALADRLRNLARVGPARMPDADPQVVLVDDPPSLHAVSQLAERHPSSSIIAGFDPLQLNDSVTDEEFDTWVASHGVSSHWLNVAYRQKEAVAKAAHKVATVVADSSPFLAENKKIDYSTARALITARCNDVVFANPSGRVRLVEHPEGRDWQRFWRDLATLRGEGKLWTHWPPLLIVKDPKADVPAAWERDAEAVSRSLPNRTVALDRVCDIKGLEFQHALLLLARDTFTSLEQGFVGSGRRSYDLFRLLRIPFSRAKDSMTTFVLA